MKIGYARVSKDDGSQVTDLQTDALKVAGVERIYEDQCSGKLTHRPQLDACLKALRAGDTLVVWRLDRLGRDTPHLLGLVTSLREQGVGLRILSGIGDGEVDTATANGQMIFTVFAMLAEFERNLIVERTRAGLAAARARGRVGGHPLTVTRDKLLLASAAMKDPNCQVRALCKQLGISKTTLYRYVKPDGSFAPEADRVLNTK